MARSWRETIKYPLITDANTPPIVVYSDVDTDSCDESDDAVSLPCVETSSPVPDEQLGKAETKSVVVELTKETHGQMATLQKKKFKQKIGCCGCCFL